MAESMLAGHFYGPLHDQPVPGVYEEQQLRMKLARRADQLAETVANVIEKPGSPVAVARMKLALRTYHRAKEELESYER